MFSVIFEVHPHTDRKDEYLTLGKQLKPILEGIDGFIDNERFESLMRPGWVLSHSSWRDEKSLVRWRAPGRAPRRATQGGATRCSRTITCASAR
jgi:heme-degrading monooxygenase HmoA